MASARYPTLSPEVWAQVMQHCSTRTLKRLALVSHSCCEEARRRMYHSVYFGEGSRFQYDESYGTQIRDLRLLYQNLRSTWSAWRNAVQNVRIEWSNGLDVVFREPQFGPETKNENQFNKLVQLTALLLSESTVLKSLHLSPPRLDSSIPLVIPYITSLRIPITGSLQETDDPGYETLLQLFQIPSLRRVELDSMLRLILSVPEHCRQPGTSSVTELLLYECGPISREIEDLLRWPKDLQTLHFDISVPMHLKTFESPNAPLLNKTIVDTLIPFGTTLQDLSIWAFDMDEPLPEGAAFQSFTKLKRLRIPSDMLMGFSDDFPEGEFQLPAPIQTQLPSSLQKFEIEIMRDYFCWNTQDEHGSWDSAGSAMELCAWLSGLAEYKSCSFPRLRELHILVNDPDDGYTLEKDPDKFPRDGPQIRQFLSLMQASDIAVFFH